MSLQTDIINIYKAARRASETVIWENSNIPTNQRPDTPFIALSLSNIRKLGLSEDINLKKTDGIGAAERLKYTQRNHYEMTVNCQYFSEGLLAQLDAETLQASLDSRSIYEYMLGLDSDIRIKRFGPITLLPRIVQASFEPRALFDSIFNVAISREELVNFVEVIENMSGTVGDYSKTFDIIL